MMRSFWSLKKGGAESAQPFFNLASGGAYRGIAISGVPALLCFASGKYLFIVSTTVDA